MRTARPVGVITRGTTNPNRLRRIDRWLTGPRAGVLRDAAQAPLVVDLGYGASPVTTLELFRRLQPIRPDIEVVGIEIDPARVEAALGLERPGLTFRHGGFEMLPGRRPVVVRAANVLRQYDESQVTPVWRRLTDGLAPGGIVVDGTCDEIGRRHAWVDLGPSGPRSLTVSVHLGSLVTPSSVAERLPKVLIHRNVPGERVHDLLNAWDETWKRFSSIAPFGRRQRFVASVHALRDAGWPLLDGPRRWRLGEITVAWDAVRPRERP